MAKKQVPKAKKPKPKTKRNSSMAVSKSLDKQWQIESDARTLKEAMAIQGDLSRVKAAKEYCTKEMEALKAVSKMKT